MTRLANKVSLITGGTTGIGLAAAKLFLAEGADVIITGRNPDNLAAASKELGEKVLAVRADAANLQDTDALMQQIKDRFGRLDVVFINAGIAQFAPIDQVDEGLVDRTFDVNFKGAFFTAQKALPLLSEGSSIIFTSSLVTRLGLPNTSIYTASKAALSSLGRTLAGDLAPRGIRVNVLSPGPITTPIYGKLGYPAEVLDGFTASMKQTIAMKRFGTPEEVAATALFLASDESAYITGEDVGTGGGFGSVLPGE